MCPGSVLITRRCLRAIVLPCSPQPMAKYEDGSSHMARYQETRE